MKANDTKPMLAMSRTLLMSGRAVIEAPLHWKFLSGLSRRDGSDAVERCIMGRIMPAKWKLHCSARCMHPGNELCAQLPRATSVVEDIGSPDCLLMLLTCELLDASDCALDPWSMKTRQMRACDISMWRKQDSHGAVFY